MELITRGLSSKLLALATPDRKRIFPAWPAGTYRRAFESQWSYARLDAMLERSSLPGIQR